MSTSRIQYLGAFGLVATVGLGLFFVLAVQPGSTAAATRASGAPDTGSRLAHSAQASSKIAFIRASELYVMNADGSKQQKLTQNVRPVTPSWSPDGRTIAFVTNRDGNAELYVMNGDRSGERRLTLHPLYDGDPAWSPNGQKIAFVRAFLRQGAGSTHSEIYVMNADGSEQRSLTRHEIPAPDDARPVWSPDGQRIAFVRAIAFARPKPPHHSGPPGPIISSRRYLYVVNADGRGLQKLTRKPEKYAGLTPIWSLDGQKIRWGRYVVNADGSGLRRVTHQRPGGVWSPDGRKVAFVGGFHIGSPRANHEIYVMNADGSGLRRLTNNPAGDTSPTWSPDGRKIAFRSNRDGNWEIYVMNADGSRQQRLTRSPADDGWFAWSPER